ncbi:MAG: hypothetical protein COV72_08895 [Candidatus Omnitrophica bacterium CG11_big_fil_rev_8_21_14_0_20_42_13]|uniref:CAAX prenyl protease 2/Lysostaphin resistance protein A-like domain-containing protein n=1 Tax=Candidatus Ghiorseimicrobium undicola TaxID=1974746 RepID=A0A2H0LVH1_9BACT|nr:MAG: hypothetical protein COV72_08895 [Candidatus Omnitrophica bacterium CG11_big_fil_rev_8_21_14_0_20_42_13]
MARPKIVSSVAWLILAVAGLSAFLLLFNHAFPIASVDIKLTKEEALNRAKAFLSRQDFDLSGFDKAVIFDADDEGAAYLQKNFGIKKFNQLAGSEVPIWFWRVRWFKELEKEGFKVRIDPSTGEVLSFHHLILDDAEGADLEEAQAILLASSVIASQGINLSDYELKENSTQKQKNRTDYRFSWEKKHYKLKDAVIRVFVYVYGDKLGYYSRQLKIPEAFKRELKREIALGEALSLLSVIFTFLLVIATIFTLITEYKNDKLNWRFGLVAGCIVILFNIVYFINCLPLLWSMYPDTMSKGVFIIISFFSAFINALVLGMAVFVYGSVGDSLARSMWRTKTPLLDALRDKNFTLSLALPKVIAGYSLGFIFLGYVTIFYLIGTRFFNIWMPPHSEYSNILGTAMPFLFPLTVALTAAFSEEFMFRLFAISFLKKYVRFAWAAILISSLIWALGHSTYSVFPAYVRAVELTIFGFIFGIVFLKYGLETVIIAHFVIDAFLGAMPLLKSSNVYFLASGLIVLSMAFIPFIIMAVIKQKGNKT